MEKYIETLYLIGCYMVVADKEINALEVDALDNILIDYNIPELVASRNKIFSDAEDKPNYYKLLNQLSLVCQSKEQKERVIRFLAQVACADGFIGSQKQAIIDDAASALRISPSLIVNEEEQFAKESLESSRMNRIMRLWGSTQKFFYDSFANKLKQNTLDRMFGGAAFQSVLEGITDQALVDFERVARIMDELGYSLQDMCRDISNLSSKQVSKKKELEEIHNILSEVHTHFNELIDVSLTENLEMLNKKQRNIRFFTIAFMGRTKAGKSTLHKVMTQEDSDDIGIGKLRTTRYNRSWYWDKLRVVDTPGIGAPGGEVDTDIAKSIIDEADLICYVVTNDSIQETEFNFFSTIKEHNKPLYIILNVKSNLSDDKRLEKFLKDPTKWKNAEGRESIQGHIDRIHDKLDGKYNMSAVKIIPLHLLAAQIATCSETEKSVAQILLEGSNFLEFTNSIKGEVYDSGCLKKSLSIIEGSAYQVHHVSKSIKIDCEQLGNNKESLKKRYFQYKNFLCTESSRLLSDVESYYEAGRIALHNRAASFAEEHYDDSDAGKKWGEDSVVKSALDQLNRRISSRVDDYRRKAETELEELFSDLSVDLKVDSASTTSGDSVVNVRLGLGIVGALATAATPFVLPLIFSNPVGWVVGLATLGVGLVVTLFTKLCTSKEEKIKKAIEKMKKELIKEIDNNIASSKSKGMDQLRQSTAKIELGIDVPFKTYINGVEELLGKLNELIKTTEFNEGVINSLIGFRILDYIGKSPIKDRKVSALNNSELVTQFPVVRDWEGHTITFSYPVKCSRKQLQKAEAAIQMHINTKD